MYRVEFGHWPSKGARLEVETIDRLPTFAAARKRARVYARNAIKAGMHLYPFSPYDRLACCVRVVENATHHVLYVQTYDSTRKAGAPYYAARNPLPHVIGATLIGGALSREARIGTQRLLQSNKFPFKGAVAPLPG